jgi:DNA repair protein RecO
MQAEPVRQAACAVIAEISRAFAHEGQADEDTFRLVGAVLDAIERGGEPWLLLRYFEFWTLALHGLLPDLEACAGCGSELPSATAARVTDRRGLLCQTCPAEAGEREARLVPVDRTLLRSMRRVPPSALDGQRPEGASRRAIELVLRGSLETFAERGFKTYRHFRVAESLPSEDASW